jgi:hypothetical protein
MKCAARYGLTQHDKSGNIPIFPCHSGKRLLQCITDGEQSSAAGIAYAAD